jgi:hypothetical protein
MKTAQQIIEQLEAWNNSQTQIKKGLMLIYLGK